MLSSASLEAMLVWRLFADGKLTVAYRPQHSCATKLLDFVACLTWALGLPCLPVAALTATQSLIHLRSFGVYMLWTRLHS